MHKNNDDMGEVSVSILKSIKKSRIEDDIRFILFNTYMIISAILGLVFAIIHTVNKRPMSNIIISIIIFVLCSFWYILSKKYKKANIARLSFLFFITFIYVPLGYWTSPGSTSAMLYLILLVIVIITFVSVKKWEYIFSGVILVETLIFLHTELSYPDHYMVYTDPVYRITDISINFSVVAIAIMVTIYYVMKRYNKHSDMLYELSITDGLTGLYNRRFFSDFVKTEYNRYIRSGQQFSLVFIDINHFKKINDDYGHSEGDKVLRDIAGIIIENIRNYDIAARYGGDEYIIILPDTTLEQAKSNMKRMQEEFNAYSQKYKDANLSVGFGVADSKDKTLDEIIQLADDALYKNKREIKSKEN